jgi:hypothetical protein
MKPHYTDLLESYSSIDVLDNYVMSTANLQQVYGKSAANRYMQLELLS